MDHGVEEEPVSITMLSLPALALHFLPNPGAVQPHPVPAEAKVAAGQEAVLPGQALREPPVRSPEAKMVPVAIIRPFAPAEFMESRLRGRSGRIGKFSWSLESERTRPISSDRFALGKTPHHRTLALEGVIGWDIGNEQLIARAGSEKDKRPDRVASGDQAFAKTRALVGGIGWSHAGQWRFDLSLRDTTAQAKSPMARLIDLASGSPRAERQIQAQFSLAPMAYGGSKSLTLGAQASTGRLKGFDRTLAGSGAPRDTGASVFARLAF